MSCASTRWILAASTSGGQIYASDGGDSWSAARYPMLKGTIREHDTKQRRAFVRFFACGEDYSMVEDSTILPEKVLRGGEPFMIVGAIAGG
jgi:hypothetical protein